MKRFYDKSDIEEAQGGWRVILDGRPIRTQGGSAQIVPNETLARALADEWAAQGEEIDTSAFLFRDYVDSAIDIVAPDREAAIVKLLSYAETDTLCYRADPEDALFKRQQEDWDPLLEAVEERFGARLERISGIVHKPQPPAALAALRRVLEDKDDFVLAGLTGAASLAASLSTALLALEDDIDPQPLWRDVSLEEEWQAELWGREEEAERRREARAEAFGAAAAFLHLAKPR